MKTSLPSFCCALGAIVLAGCAGRPAPGPAPAPTGRVQPGDVVFQASRTNQAPAIREAQGSRYSHCGIVVERGGRLHVAEAIKPVRVTSGTVTLKAWIDRGIGGHAVAKRLRGGLSAAQMADLEQAMRPMHGRPYDELFQRDNTPIYCSEFIYDAYKRGLKKQLGREQPFSELDLSGEKVRALIKTRYTDRGRQFDPSRLIITPKSVMESSELETVAVYP